MLACRAGDFDVGGHVCCICVSLHVPLCADWVHVPLCADRWVHGPLNVDQVLRCKEEPNDHGHPGKDPRPQQLVPLNVDQVQRCKEEPNDHGHPGKDPRHNSFGFMTYFSAGGATPSWQWICLIFRKLMS